MIAGSFHLACALLSAVVCLVVINGSGGDGGGEWATTKHACRDELVVGLLFLPYILRSTSMY